MTAGDVDWPGAQASLEETTQIWIIGAGGASSLVEGVMGGTGTALLALAGVSTRFPPDQTALSLPGRALSAGLGVLTPSLAFPGLEMT